MDRPRVQAEKERYRLR